MSLRSALRSRLLRAVGSVAVVAVLATPALPSAASDEVEPLPSAGSETPAPPEESEPTEAPDPEPEPAVEEPVEEPAEEPTEVPTEEPTEEPVEEPVPTVPVPSGPACLGGALGTGAASGASNPLDGTRWVATVAAPGRLLLSRSLEGGALTAPLATLDLPGAPGTAGGLTFGGDGRLYVVAGADAGGEAVLYRTALPLRPTAAPLTATEVSRTRTDAPVTRIAFTRDGLLHLAYDGGSAATDPVTGEAVAVLDPAQGQALPCGRPSQVTVRVSLPQGRAEAADQLAVTLTGAAYDGSPASPRGVTAGTDTGRQAKLGEYVQVLALPGAAYGVALTATDGGAPTSYDVTLDCLDGTDVLVDRAGPTGTLTMPARSAYVTCTFTAVPAVDDPEVDDPAADVPEVDEPRRDPVRTGPSVLLLDRDGLPGSGLGTDPEKDQGGGTRDAGGSGGTGGQDLGRDLGSQMQQDGALGGGLGGGMPGAIDTDTGTDTKAQETTGSRAGKDLPNTGGPPAVLLPIGLGAVVLGSVLVVRRRREA